MPQPCRLSRVRTTAEPTGRGPQATTHTDKPQAERSRGRSRYEDRAAPDEQGRGKCFVNVVTRVLIYWLLVGRTVVPSL